VAQEEELRALKDRMLSGAPLPGLGAASGAAARNKMLIRGGSSFNALVRGGRGNCWVCCSAVAAARWPGRWWRRLRRRLTAWRQRSAT
jgi:hypothetical protein